MLWLTLRRRGVGCGVVGLRQGQRNPSQHRSAAETEHQNLITPPRPPPRPPSPTTTITTASCPQHPNPPSQASLLPRATRTSHPRPPDPLHPPAHASADPSRPILSRGERSGQSPPAANRRTFPVFIDRPEAFSSRRHVEPFRPRSPAAPVFGETATCHVTACDGPVSGL